MRILSFIGTRPEALKMGPVIRVLRSTTGVDSMVCTTGQQRELVKDPLALFGVVPQFDLALKHRGLHPDELLAYLLPQMGSLVAKTKPDWIMAAGDTTSAMCAGLTAIYRRVRFAHVEAGLRTGRMQEPFPEEFHRRVSAIAADLHFAPNAGARENLLRESIPRRSIVVTGNPIIDAMRMISAQHEILNFPGVLRRVGLNDPRRKLLLVTFHRRENIGKPVENICSALRTLATLFSGELTILCLVHPNPRISVPARRLLGNTPNIVLSPPVDYPTTLALLSRTTLLLTDSGGLQEEAPYLRIPVLVLRNVTERPEGVAAGVAKLVGTDAAVIVSAARRLLKSPASRRTMVDEKFRAYGDGGAAKRIVTELLRRTGVVSGTGRR